MNRDDGTKAAMAVLPHLSPRLDAPTSFAALVDAFEAAHLRGQIEALGRLRHRLLQHGLDTSASIVDEYQLAAARELASLDRAGSEREG